MIVTGAAGHVNARGSPRARHRVELLSASSGLGNRSRQESSAENVKPQGYREAKPCHSDTPRSFDLFESRLNSTFVAHVLGQGLLTKRADESACRRAYAQAASEALRPK